MALAAAALSGCVIEATPVEPSDALAAAQPCPAAPAPVVIEGRVPIRLFVGAGLKESTATSVVADVQAVFERYGITFSVYDTHTITDAPILGGTLAEIEPRLRAALTTSDTDAGRAVVVATALEPVRRFLERHSTPPRRGLDLVVLTRVVDDRSVAATLLGDIAGIGLAPGVVEVPRGALPRAYTPTAFVSVTDLATLDPAAAAIVAAHEVAHALGLRHDSRQWNLMNPATGPCLPALDHAQLDALASSSAVRR